MSALLSYKHFTSKWPVSHLLFPTPIFGFSRQCLCSPGCRQGWPPTKRSTFLCLLNAGIQGERYHSPVCLTFSLSTATFWNSYCSTMYMYLGVFVYMNAVPRGKKKGLLDRQKLVVKLQTWVLGTEQGSSARVTSALHHWAISLAQILRLLLMTISKDIFPKHQEFLCAYF